MAGVEIASAYVTLLPSMKGFGKNIEKQMGAEGRKAGEGFNSGFGRALGKLGTVVKRAAQVGMAAAGVAAGAALIGGFRSAISQQNTERVLDGLYGSAEAATDMMGRLHEIARNSPIEFAGYAAGAESLAYMGVEGERAQGILENIGAAITTSGGGAAEMGRATDAMIRMENAGKVQLDTLNQLSEAGVPIYSGLAEHFGVDVANIRDMVSEGKVGIEDVLSVSENATGKWWQRQKEAAEEVSKSFGNQWKIAKDAVIVAIGRNMIPLLERLTPVLTWIGEHGPAAIEGVANWLGRMFDQISAGEGPLGWLPDFFATVGDAARDAFTWIRDEGVPALRAIGDWIADNKAPIIAVASGIAAVGGALLAMNAVTSVVAGVVKGITLLRGALTLLAAHPILLALGLFAAAFVYLWQTNDTFREKVTEAFHKIKDVTTEVWTNTVQPAIMGVWDWIRDTLIPGILSFWNDSVKPVFTNIGDIVVEAWHEKIWPALKGLWDTIQTQVIPVIVSLWEDVVKPTFAFIGETVMMAWENFIAPALQALVSFVVDVLIPNILWLWSEVILPVFSAIGRIVVSVWENLILPTLTRLRDFIFNVVAPVVLWLWENVVLPAFEGIAATIKWAWENVVRPVFNFLVDFLTDTLMPGFNDLWTVVDDVWQWISDAISFAWDKIVKPVFDALWGFIKDTLIPIFQSVWEKVEEVWQWIGDAIDFAWDKVIRPVFNSISGGVDWLIGVFESAVEGIGTAWSWLREFLSKPIVAILEFVNDKLIGGINTVLDWVNIPGIPTIPIPSGLQGGPVFLPRGGGPGRGGGGNNRTPIAAADGMVLPGWSPGKDDLFFAGKDFDLALAGGEAIMRPEWTKAVGAGFVDEMNAAARHGGVAGVRKALGFASGGVLPGVLPGPKGGPFDWVGDAVGAVGDFAKGIGKFIKDPIGFVKDFMLNGIGALLDNPFVDFLKGAVGKIAGSVKDKLWNLVMGSGEGDVGSENAPGSVVGNWPMIWALIKANTPNPRMTSNFRPGAITASGFRSYHGRGQAVDFVSSNMLRDFFAIRNLLPWRELYYSPAGMAQLRNGRPHYPTGITRANHFDHIHAAYAKGGIFSGEYDSGGYIPPGLSLVANNTGKPEPVLTPEQWDKLEAGGGNTINLYGVPLDVAGDVASTINYEIRRNRRGKYARR